MKQIFTCLMVLIGGLMLASCGNNNRQKDRGVAFNPQARESKFNDYERESRIAAKRAELNVDIEALLEKNPIRMFIIKPATDDNIKKEHADMVGRRLLAMAAFNGVAADGENPIFVLGGNLELTDIQITETTPQKYVAKYNLEILIGNAITGDRYASTMLSLVGAGSSKRDAINMAMQQIENNSSIQTMFADANRKIIDWYESNLDVLRNDVAELQSSGECQTAIMLLSSVPVQAVKSFSFAQEMLPTLLAKERNERAADNFAQMKMHMSASPEKFDKMVAAFYNLIPADHELYAAATEIYNQYASSVGAEDLAAKKYAAEQAAIEAQWQRDHADLLVKADSKVQMAQARSGHKRSTILGNGLLGLGKLFDNAGDLIHRYFDERI